jgi:hypothetical protein
MYTVLDDIDLVFQSIVARKLTKQGHSLRQELATKMVEKTMADYCGLDYNKVYYETATAQNPFEA